MSTFDLPELTITRNMDTGFTWIEWDGDFLQSGEGIYIPGDDGIRFVGLDSDSRYVSYAVDA